MDITALLKQSGEYLLLGDKAPLLFALAVAISAAGTGEPLWGMFIGPPSSGKSEIIRLLERVTKEHIKDLTGPGLISWSTTGELRAVGVLPRIGSTPALVTISDFSPLLADAGRGGKDQLFALLRDVYDGRVARALGNMPKALRWEGRITILAACVPSLDHQRAHHDSLGPRFLSLRLRSQGSKQRRMVALRALQAGERGAARHESQRIAAEIVLAGRERLADVTLSSWMQEALVDAAELAGMGRGAVPRATYGKREILDRATAEEPGRIAVALSLLARSVLAMGEDESTALGLCRRVALDTMPAIRRDVLGVLASTEEPLATARIAAALFADWKVTNRSLEDLAAVGIVERAGYEDDGNGGKFKRKTWRLADEYAPLLRQEAITRGL